MLHPAGIIEIALEPLPGGLSRLTTIPGMERALKAVDLYTEIRVQMHPLRWYVSVWASTFKLGLM